jgi:L-amino acid N-acyltransferase YncA
MNIRSGRLADASKIVEIYNDYIRSSHATFEVEPIDPVEMENRMSESVDNDYPFIVAEENGRIAGYAYGQRYRSRTAYIHSIEISVYIDREFVGRGLGTDLYNDLIPGILASGFHAVIAGISLPNNASIRLHEKFGFKKIAHFKEVGRKFDRWIDVGYWELINTTH